MKAMKQVKVNVGDPVAGNVVEIRGQRLIVVEGGQQVSEDRIRGDAYYAYVFKTIRADDLNKKNPTETTWVLKGGSMGVENAEMIDSEEIDLVEVNSLHKKTDVTYTLSLHKKTDVTYTV